MGIPGVKVSVHIQCKNGKIPAVALDRPSQILRIDETLKGRILTDENGRPSLKGLDNYEEPFRCFAVTILHTLAEKGGKMSRSEMNRLISEHPSEGMDTLKMLAEDRYLVEKNGAKGKEFELTPGIDELVKDSFRIHLRE